MGYETGTATNQQDFLDKLQTFVGANGWTVHEFDLTNKTLSISINTVFIHFRWDAVPTTGGIAMYQSLGFIGTSTDPDEHTNDSGNGASGTGPVVTERRMNDIGNGPFENYWFFLSDEGGADYLYVVLEYSPGKFSGFCAGEIVKYGTWTGGEFAGTISYEGAFNVNDSRHNFLLDGRCTEVTELATIHCEGLPGQPGAGKWAVVGNPSFGTVGNDGDGNARTLFTGGFREGPLAHTFQGMVANPSNGYVPMIPIQIFGRTTDSGNDFRYMGKMPHIRMLNGKNLVAGEEFTVGGSETWKVFPMTSKVSSGTPNSGNMFYAVRKIT